MNNPSVVDEKTELSLLKHLYQNNSVIFHLTPRFKIAQTNSVAAQVFNKNTNALINKPLLEIIVNHNNSVTHSLRQLLNLTHNPSFPAEPTFQVNNKQYTWELIESTDNNEKQLGFILIGHDVTYYAKRANEYRQISGFLRKLIKIMPNYVVWKDTHSVYLGCNNNFSSLMALEKSNEIIGKTAYSFLSQSDAQAFEEEDKHVVTTGQAIFNKEMTVRFPERERSTVLLTCIPICEKEGHVIGVLSTLTDVTQHPSNAEKPQTSNKETDSTRQAVSDFLASMSHDLRTPLNSIIMSSQFLQENVQDKDQKELVNAIAKSADILLRLVQDILNSVQVENGQLELHTDAFDVRKTTEEIFSMIAHKAREKNLDLILSYNEFVPRLVVGDSFCFHRILFSLLDNAIKFTHTGYVLVKFDSYEINDGKIILSIAVEDTGIGIEKSQLQHIFERFTRLDPTYKGRYKGMGLGLPVVKELVEKMDGHISTASQPQQGSTFSVTLPFAQQKIVTRRSIWNRHYSDLSILVVDDLRPRGQVILKQIASSKGRLVTSGDAIRTLEESKQKAIIYDVILIDCQLTEINSLELARLIKNDDAFKNSLLIYLTNPCSLSSIDAAKQAGFFTLLTKPTKPSELLKTLESAWGQWLLTRKGERFLLDTLNPVVLLIEKDLLLQKMLKLILNELGYIADVKTSCEPDAICKEKSYDILMLDVDSVNEKVTDLIKKIRENEDISNPIPIILAAEHVKKRDERALLKFAPTRFVSKPIDHLELQQMLLRCLFQCNGEE